MRKFSAFAALLALAAAGLPGGGTAAIAADVGQLDCPATRLTEQQRSAFAAYLADGQISRTDSRFVAFQHAVRDCAETLAWTQPVAELAYRYTVSALAQAENRRRLDAAGFDVAAIERSVLADPQLIAASATGPYPEQELRAFITRLDAAVEAQLRRDATGRATESLGMFVMFRAMMEAARAAFAAD